MFKTFSCWRFRPFIKNKIFKRICHSVNLLKLFRHFKWFSRTKTSSSYGGDGRSKRRYGEQIQKNCSEFLSKYFHYFLKTCSKISWNFSKAFNDLLKNVLQNFFENTPNFVQAFSKLTKYFAKLHKIFVY